MCNRLLISPRASVITTRASSMHHESSRLSARMRRAVKILICKRDLVKNYLSASLEKRTLIRIVIVVLGGLFAFTALVDFIIPKTINLFEVLFQSSGDLLFFLIHPIVFVLQILLYD